MRQPFYSGVAWMAFLVATPLTTSQPTMQLFQQIFRHVHFAHRNSFCWREPICNAKWRENVRGDYMMEVGGRYWIGVGVMDVIYLARGIKICERALDAASNNDTAPAKASGPSSCAARGKWISCSISTG